MTPLQAQADAIAMERARKKAEELATLRGAAWRALRGSPRWKVATREFTMHQLDSIGPLDLEACAADELDDINLWATGKRDAMPAHLAAYLGAVREATR